MGDSEKPEVKYLTRHCPFVKQEVWAILTKQSDGTWEIVNCLDKDKICFQCDCAFTVDGGEWPFADAAIDDSRLKDRP